MSVASADRVGTGFAPRSLGEWLQLERLILGIRQEDLARELGVSRVFVGYVEQGRRYPSGRVFADWLVCLGLAPASLSPRVRRLSRPEGEVWSTRRFGRARRKAKDWGVPLAEALRREGEKEKQRRRRQMESRMESRAMARRAKEMKVRREAEDTPPRRSPPNVVTRIPIETFRGYFRQ